MAVGTVQLFDSYLPRLLGATGGTVLKWNATAHYATLWEVPGSPANPSDAADNYAGVDATHNESADTGITRPVLGSQAVNETGGPAPRTQCESAIISFGSNVTLSAKYLIVFQGTAITPPTAQTSTDFAVFWVDLNDTSLSAEASSTAAAFTIDDSATGWFYIAGQL